VLPGRTERRAGPAGERDAARWLASQDRGWRDGDRLSFAVLRADDAGGFVLAGNVGLKNREEAGRVGERETAEIGYWTAVAARGRGIAPAAVRAVTEWVFEAFAGARLRQVMLVHDVGNPAVVFFLGQGLPEVSGQASDPSAGPVMIWLQVRDVRAEHDRLAAAGVRVLRQPVAEPWGLIEMWIEDPDGIKIVLVEVPADHPLRRDPR
jgi:predicted enzyme related to lactoylglutathione lyase